MFALLIGLLAASQSGNIIRLGQASALAIASWRLILATIIMGASGWKGISKVKDLSRKEKLLILFASISLSLHLIFWITSVQKTSVANAMIFFAINPLFTTAGAWIFLKERPTKKILISTFIGFFGVLVLFINDLNDISNTIGNIAALGSTLFFSAYFLAGKKAQLSLNPKTYVSILYGLASIPCFIGLLLTNEPIIDYNLITWICFILMAIVPTAIGHTAINKALRTMKASKVSAATLVEPLMGGTVAWLVWDEQISASSIIGYVLITISVLILLISDLRNHEEP